MKREEAIKILSILKAAYPNSYKGMTKDEANGTINIWAAQFSDMPYFVVAIAVNKLISTSTFPPSIKEVKGKIRGLYWETWQLLYDHKQNDINLDEKTVATLEEILRVVEPLRTKEFPEPSLGTLIAGFGGSYLEYGTQGVKKLED